MEDIDPERDDFEYDSDPDGLSQYSDFTLAISRKGDCLHLLYSIP